jgi:Zn-dependent metalloprotease
MLRKVLHVSLGIALVATSLVPLTSTEAAGKKSDKASSWAGRETQQYERIGLPNVDARRDSTTLELNGGFHAKAAPRDVRAAVESFRSKIPGSPESLWVDLMPSGTPKTVSRTEGPLSEARVGSADEIARGFLAENTALFGLSAREVRNLRVSMNNHDESTGVTYMKYVQTIRGVEVFDSEIGVTVGAKGEVWIVNQGQILPGADVQFKPALSMADAIETSFGHCNAEVSRADFQLIQSKTDAGFARYANPLGEGREDILARRMIVNVNGVPVLAYRVMADVRSSEWYDTLVDANTGDLLYRFNLYSDVQGQVFTSSPGLTLGNSRSTVQIAPLFGVTDPWVGAGTVSTGNNVDAYIDRDANNAPDSTTTTSTGSNPGLTGGRADSTKGTPAGEFTFVYSNANAPTVQQANAVTNLWYFNNFMHDWMYSLGFTESARNFQTNNFGRGGAQNDHVRAEAQDGSGTNNANFATPPDGSSGRMQQYIFTSPNPDRDSDLDGDVVFHEYGHGVSNRLIGNGSGLGGIQSGAMGEGWGDYWACSNYNDGVMGEYSVNSSAGIRRAVYAVPSATVHDSYADVGNSGFEVHDDGEVWAAALFDLFQAIGKTKADKIILDGMKNTPSSPSMVSARSGIITACNTNFPADVCAVWTVFARHGLGNSASGNDGTTHNAATDLPASCTGGCSFSLTPTSASVGSAATTGSVSVTTGSSCAWTATSNASWLTITSGASGTGNGTVNYSVAANSGSSSRSGTLTIAGLTFTVNQAAGSTPTIDCGGSVSGALATSDSRSTVRGSSYYADTYTFTPASSGTATINLGSTTGLDTYLIVKATATSTTAIAQDDDAGPGTDSLISLSVTGGTTYYIEATSYSANATGSYNLSVGCSGGATTVLSEGAESGAAGWTVTTNASGNNWVISANGRRTGANGFRSNNATATYPNNLDQSLISPSFSLAGKSSASLNYYYKQQTETSYDFLRVEVSTNGGSTWTSLSAVSTTSTGFTTTAGAGMVSRTISLNPYVGQANVKIRFRLTTDVSVVYWGAAIDDIAVTAN